MRVISFIDDQDFIEKILKHRCLLEAEPGLPPRMPRSQLLYTEPLSIIQTPRSPFLIMRFITSPLFKTADVSWRGTGALLRFSISSEVMT
jgi:hypothetical protein